MQFDFPIFQRDSRNLVKCGQGIAASNGGIHTGEFGVVLVRFKNKHTEIVLRVLLYPFTFRFQLRTRKFERSGNWA